MLLVILNSEMQRIYIERQVGSKSTPKFAYGLAVDSRELVETERLHRGLASGLSCSLYPTTTPLVNGGVMGVRLSLLDSTLHN